MARKTGLVIGGDFQKELRGLPEALASEASHIIVNSANHAAMQIIAAYPRHTGNLKGGVEVVTFVSKWRTRATVVNRAPHAFIYEHGTEARHYFTKGGERHETGRMPPGHVFDPIVRRWQRRKDAALAALLKKYGLKVRDAA